MNNKIWPSYHMKNYGDLGGCYPAEHPRRSP